MRSFAYTFDMVNKSRQYVIKYKQGILLSNKISEIWHATWQKQQSIH